MAQCLIVGLNPAWQKVFQFSRIKQGEVNRAVSSAECAAGKGLNTARILTRLGHKCDVLQILGGDSGKKILNYCRETKIGSKHFLVKNPTRLCLTLLEKGRETELIEPFGIEEDEAYQFERELPKRISSRKKYEAVVFCGTLPEGLKPDTFESILKTCSAKKVFLDGYTGFNQEFLDKVHFLKINGKELEALLQAKKSKTAEVLLKTQLPELKLLMVTHGKKPADIYYQNSNASWRHNSIKVPKVQSVNAIGAGDSTHGGLVHSVLKGISLKDSCKFGLALGSASCLEMLPAHFQEQNLQIILSEMTRANQHG